MSLNWKGAAVTEAVAQAAAEAVTEIGLRVEGAAKRKLSKGHGVVTGTLRRSIHTATPGYDWRGDDTEPSEGSPELGGDEAEAKDDGNRIAVQTGSGLEYALAVHQGHDGFEGYHFLTEALEEVKGEVVEVLRRHIREALGGDSD